MAFLSQTHPDVSLDARALADGSALPVAALTAGMKRLVTWECPAGHEKVMRVADRVRRGCSDCNSLKGTPRHRGGVEVTPVQLWQWVDSAAGIEEIIRRTRLAQEVVDAANLAITTGSTRRITWRCAECYHTWTARVDLRVGVGSGCPACDRDRRSAAMAQAWIEELASRQGVTPADVAVRGRARSVTMRPLHRIALEDLRGAIENSHTDAGGVTSYTLRAVADPRMHDARLALWECAGHGHYELTFTQASAAWLADRSACPACHIESDADEVFAASVHELTQGQQRGGRLVPGRLVEVGAITWVDGVEQEPVAPTAAQEEFIRRLPQFLKAAALTRPRT